MIQKSYMKNNQNSEYIQKQEITSFEELGISSDLLRGIYAFGFEKPSPIQKTAITPIVKGRDLIAQSQAGTGKTAAFTIGSLQRIDQLSEHLQVIILVPTRELAMSIFSVVNCLAQYTKIRVGCLIGGTEMRKSITSIKQKKPHIVIATPGRCKDFIQRKLLMTDHLKTIVLDQADEMLNRGFVDQVKQILEQISIDTQLLLFSATMPKEVIMITDKFMKDPVKILLKIQDIPIRAIKQYQVSLENYEQKFPTMISIYKNISVAQSIVFVNTKQTATKIAEQLKKLQFPVSLIHSDVEDRVGAMAEFKRGETRILVSTDLTGRGIDISQVNLVINYDLPCSSALEQYIHRIGRCGRFGKKGCAINLVTSGDAELMVKIQNFYKIEIPELPLDPQKILQ